MKEQVNSIIVKNILHQLESYNVDIKYFIKYFDISSLDDFNFDKWIDADKFGKFLEIVVKDTKDDRIGYKFGQTSSISTLGTVGQIYQNCHNFKDVLNAMMKYVAYLDSINSYFYEIQSNEIHIITKPNQEFAAKYPLASRQMIEHNIGFSLRHKREYLGREIKILKICTPYSKIDENDIIEKDYNCPVLFNEPYLSVVLPYEMINWKLPTANKNALEVFENIISNQFTSATFWYNITSEKIKNHIQTEVPTLQKIAYELNVSPRTLQRNLFNEGVSFQIILNKVRYTLAVSYLKQPNFSISEISDKLGFDVQNSFTRFFKKMSGINPKDYNKRGYKD